MSFTRDQQMGKNKLEGEIKLLNTEEGESDFNYLVSRGSRVRSMLSMKKNANMREIEEREDCFILDFDPNDSLDLSSLSISSVPDDDPDIAVLSETGQVACRDYPHSRHLCFKNPFKKTPHEIYCEQCYCFVCDEAAPCQTWFGSAGHCHATDEGDWNILRRSMRELKL